MENYTAFLFVGHTSFWKENIEDRVKINYWNYMF